jgi:hypothetical protein
MRTRTERIADVRAAAMRLPALIAAAVLLEGRGSEEAAWAEVEQAGAVVHRQARLLAGKSRGG